MKLGKNIAISENGFVFNASRGDSFTTNPIGAFILHQLKEGREEGQIQEMILDKYEIDAATCEKDLYDFIKVLRRNNLLTK